MSGDREPITPFITKLPALAARGVSCLLVIGGSGQYFDVAGECACLPASLAFCLLCLACLPGCLPARLPACLSSNPTRWHAAQPLLLPSISFFLLQTP